MARVNNAAAGAVNALHAARGITEKCPVGAKGTGWQLGGFPSAFEDSEPKGLKFKNNRHHGDAGPLSCSFHLETSRRQLPLTCGLGEKAWFGSNGHNLGRFWNLGPSQTMYLPGPCLSEAT